MSNIKESAEKTVQSLQAAFDALKETRALVDADKSLLDNRRAKMNRGEYYQEVDILSEESMHEQIGELIRSMVDEMGWSSSSMEC